MKSKKKVDLTSELADLLMEDIGGTTEFGKTRGLTADTRALTSTADTRRLTPEFDPDPTLAVPRSTDSLRLEEPTLSANSIPPVPPEHPETPEPKEPQMSGLSQIFDLKKDTPSVSAVRRSGSKSDVLLTAEGALIQSEQLRISQERILDLERIVETLRIENEELLAAGETLRNKADDLGGQLERQSENLRNKQESLKEQLIVAQTAAAARSDEAERLKMKVDELETRLIGDLKRIRVRERELENRLEILKLENQAILKSKDEMILDLKRKIDQLNFELESYRTKGRELNRHVEDNRERVRRTVKALRLALTMLEGEEEGAPLKKAE